MTEPKRKRNKQVPVAPLPVIIAAEWSVPSALLDAKTAEIVAAGGTLRGEHVTNDHKLFAMIVSSAETGAKRSMVNAVEALRGYVEACERAIARGDDCGDESRNIGQHVSDLAEASGRLRALRELGLRS